MKRSQKIFNIRKTEEGRKFFVLRYTPYREGVYVDPVDFVQKTGKVANFVVLCYRTDDFAKKNYSFRERVLWIKAVLAADVLDRIPS